VLCDFFPSGLVIVAAAFHKELKELGVLGAIADCEKRRYEHPSLT
jgi:hypothetical protein